MTTTANNEVAERARQTLRERARVNQLNSEATRSRTEAGRLESQVAQAIKDNIKALESADSKLKNLNEREKEIKREPEYKEADAAFKQVKEELGLNEVTRAKKERREEIKIEAEDDDAIIEIQRQIAQLNDAADAAEGECNTLRQSVETEERAVIEAVAGA